MGCKHIGYVQWCQVVECLVVINKILKWCKIHWKPIIKRMDVIWSCFPVSVMSQVAAFWMSCEVSHKVEHCSDLTLKTQILEWEVQRWSALGPSWFSWCLADDKRRFENISNMVIETKITIKYYTNIPRFMQGVNGFFITEISQRSALQSSPC